MSTWKTFWVHGLPNAFNNWLNKKRYNVDSEQILPHELFVSNPCYPLELAGTTDDGVPTYKRRSGVVKCIWVISLHGNKKDLLDEVKVLNGPYDIHEFETIEEIRALYPDHAIGAIPYIC